MGNTAKNVRWEWIALTIGLVIGFAFIISPVGISVLGSEISCGPSVMASMGLLSTSGSGWDVGLAQQCGVQGISRSLIGILFVAGGAVTFALLQGKLPASGGALVAELRNLHAPARRPGGGAYECGCCHSAWPCPTGRVLGGKPMTAQR
ncbi:hypothetical protein [Nonomuraea turkmeniaca]|uniref:hypothetical protein n=1 Tax=Nonomuraea turkmeniaca TaxID=103838 RepID=UPI0014769487|nr:hypothetical protein [Nonomuraea turkmeniaca]